MAKLKKEIKPGKKVEIIAGSNKGETGEVVKVDRSKQRVYVEGVNEKLDFTRNPLQDDDFGPKLKNIGIHISNVKLVENKNNNKNKDTKK
jgi:large subunit ribosomal protein L24